MFAKLYFSREVHTPTKKKTCNLVACFSSFPRNLTLGVLLHLLMIIKENDLKSQECFQFYSKHNLENILSYSVKTIFKKTFYFYWKTSFCYASQVFALLMIFQRK